MLCTLRQHVAVTTSQHLHTHENIAGTCLWDTLQQHVLLCKLVLYFLVQHQFSPRDISHKVQLGHAAATERCKDAMKLCVHYS